MGRPCFDENEVVAFLGGGLGESARADAETHLDVCGDCRSLVAQLADLSGTGVVPPPNLAEHASDDIALAERIARRTPQPATPGERIDHFVVTGRLGHGGMGEVYAARDTKLDRPVAIKMVRRDLAGSAEALSRLTREAQATARFSHPNIVAIHFVGEHHGQPYVALELLEGETLAERLDSAPLSPDEAVRIATAVTDALTEAHRHGVLHRDLKPDNIHIDRSERVRVLDFGLAKFLADPDVARPDEPTLSANDDVFETRASQAAGTPSYMAPEQWRGEPSSEATDIWALGGVLFTMLAGRRPYPQTSARELARAVLSSSPAPTLADAGVQLPPGLATTIAKCLDKDPVSRPTTAEVTRALARWNSGNEIASTPTPRARSRGLWAIAAVAIVLGGASWAVWSPGMGAGAGELEPTPSPGQAAAPVSAESAEEMRAPASVRAMPVAPAATPQPRVVPTPEPELDPVPTPAKKRSKPRTKPRTKPKTPPAAKPAKETLFGTRE